MLEGKNSGFLEKRVNEVLDCYNKRRHTGIGEFTIRNSGNDSRFGKKNELHFRKFTTEKNKDFDRTEGISIFHDLMTRSFSLFFYCVCPYEDDVPLQLT